MLDVRWAQLHGRITSSSAEHPLTGRPQRHMTEFWLEVLTPTGTFSHLALVATDALAADSKLYASTLERVVIELDHVLSRH